MTSDSYFVLVMGVPGSGKSTLARQIIERVHWVYLDNNFVMDPFFADTRDSADHMRHRPKFYEALYTIVARNLELGNTVLLDAPHVRPMKDPAWWRRMQTLADDAGATLRVVRCHCSEATLRARIESRNEKRDLPKLANWERFLHDEPLRTPIPLDHLDVDTDVEADAYRRVLSYVSGGDLSTLPMKQRAVG